jgi:hypothetical protein
LPLFMFLSVPSFSVFHFDLFYGFCFSLAVGAVNSVFFLFRFFLCFPLAFFGFCSSHFVNCSLGRCSGDWSAVHVHRRLAADVLLLLRRRSISFVELHSALLSHTAR